MSSCNSKSRYDEFVVSDFANYTTEYSIVKDSVKLYADSFLKDFVSPYCKAWEIDSLVCLNSERNKLVATINESNGKGKDAKMDQIEKLLGKKMNNKWYFFLGGGSLAVPRDFYKKNEMNPLTFHELSQVARKEFFAGAIVKKDGKLIVNDEWVNNHFEYNGMCAHCKTHEQFDSTHWKKITDKWKKRIDTTAFKKFVPAAAAGL
ncbi:MAG: hypothetical protein ACXVPQ_04565 [Bacteroidia bacterium]